MNHLRLVPGYSSFTAERTDVLEFGRITTSNKGMETYAKDFIVFGLILDMIGVVLLAWDILTIPGKEAFAKLMRTKIENSERVRFDAVERLSKGSDPSAEDNIRQLNEEHEELVQECEEELRRRRVTVVESSIRSAWRGLLFILGGLLLQVIGTVLS